MMHIINILFIYLGFSNTLSSQMRAEIPDNTILEDYSDLIKNQYIKQCQFLGKNKNFFSLITTAQKENNFYSESDHALLQIFDDQQQLILSSKISSKQQIVGIRKNQYKRRYLTLSENYQTLAVCSDQTDSNGFYMELEIWNIKLKKKINIFKLYNYKCSSQLKFKEDGSELAWFDPNGHVAIWDLVSGIRLPITDIISQQKCLDITSDFKSLYCFDSDFSINLYDRDSENKKWSLEKPKELSLSFAFKLFYKSLKFFKIKTPKSIFNLGTQPPVFLHSDLRSQMVFSFYRHPNHFRENEQQQYLGYLLTHDETTGKLSSKQLYLEDKDINLTNLRFYPQKNLVIGEDSNINKEGYKSFYLINFNKESQHRFGESCIEDWDLSLDSKHIIGCGNCSKKNRFKMIPIKTE